MVADGNPTSAGLGPIRFVTGNEGKVEEAKEYLPVAVEQRDVGYREIQADDLRTVAAAGARDAFERIGDGQPLIVEDSGLFIRALAGFPGPYSAYVERTLGVEGVYRTAKTEVDPPRRAAFRSAVAWAGPTADPTEEEPVVETFLGTVAGRIVAPRGSGGFGYDPIFEHDGRTMAERSTQEKNAISHRGRALAKVASWLSDE